MDENLRLLLKVSQLYYQENFTQQVIAENLGISRPKVSRLLQQAREQNIVQINIVTPTDDFTDLETKLEKQYGLKEVFVTFVANYDSHAEIMRELGKSAAKHLHRLVQDGDMIGFTWGRSLSAFVDEIMPENKENIRTIQMVGGLGDPAAETHIVDIVRRAAFALNASMELLPAPGIVETTEAHKILMSDKSIKHALDIAPKADIAYVGIGVSSLDSIVVTANIMTRDEMQRLIDLGAVGEIGLRFFDIQGDAVLSNVHDRVIGAHLSTFKNIPCTVGIAGGKEKLNAILGAIRGKYIDTLITDQNTAQLLL